MVEFVCELFSVLVASGQADLVLDTSGEDSVNFYYSPDTDFLLIPDPYLQCCGTVTIYYGSGSGSDF